METGEKTFARLDESFHTHNAEHSDFSKEQTPSSSRDTYLDYSKLFLIFNFDCISVVVIHFDRVIGQAITLMHILHAP